MAFARSDASSVLKFPRLPTSRSNWSNWHLATAAGSNPQLILVCTHSCIWFSSAIRFGTDVIA
eukprot:3446403-Pyramimonas_sp.AAC.1